MPTKPVIINPINGNTNRIQTEAGHQYRISDIDNLTLKANVLVMREGDDLVLHYADGTVVILEDFYTVCVDEATSCQVALPDSADGNGQKEYHITPATQGTALSDGSIFIYAQAHDQGALQGLLALAAGNGELESILNAQLAGVDAITREVVKIPPSSDDQHDRQGNDQSDDQGSSGTLLGALGVLGAIGGDSSGATTPNPGNSGDATFAINGALTVGQQLTVTMSPTITGLPTINNPPVADGVRYDGSTYRFGDTIDITVTFNEAVVVTGMPRIGIRIGGVTRQANYARSSNGNTELVFQYTVQDGDNDADGISITQDSIRLNSGSIQDSAGNNADLAHGFVADNNAHRVHTFIGNAKGNKFIATAGHEHFDGQDGVDFVSYENAGAVVAYQVDADPDHNVNIAIAGVTGIYINLNKGGTQSGNNVESVGDVLINIEGLIGSVYRDFLVGDWGNNVLEGGAGR